MVFPGAVAHLTRKDLMEEPQGGGEGREYMK
jgi:hypothetical protein